MAAPRPGLIACVAALMAAAFLAPPLLPQPDLREGRKLAAPPRLDAGLDTLRSQTDAYVADNFPARRLLIAGLNYLRLQAGISGSDKVLIGREGWLYYNDGSLLASARGAVRLGEDEAAGLTANLAGRAEHLAAQGAQYLVVAAPVQEAIYPEHAPAWFRLDPTRDSVRLAGLAQAAVPGRLLHLEPALRQAKARGVEVFSRHDTHWTGDGAYAGYAAIMAALRAQGLDQPTRPLSDFVAVEADPKRPRDLARMIGVASFVDVRYRAYRDPAAAGWRTAWLRPGRRDFTAPQVLDTGALGKPTLLMQRDSFSNALLPFLAGHFGRIVLTHIDDGAWRPELAARYRPDFVILEVQENGLPAVLSPAPPASGAARARIAGAREAGRTLRPTSAALRAELAAARPAPGCAVDTAAFAGGNLELAGWISELRAEPGHGRGLVRLRGAGRDLVQEAPVALPRPDLAAVFGKPVGEPNGYRLRLAAPPPGEYRLSIYRRTRLDWIACEGPRLRSPAG